MSLTWLSNAMMVLHFSCSGNHPLKKKVGGGGVGNVKAAYQLPFLGPIEVGVLCIGYNLFYINAMCVELVLGVGGPRCKWFIGSTSIFLFFFCFCSFSCVCVEKCVYGRHAEHTCYIKSNFKFQWEFYSTVLLCVLASLWLPIACAYLYLQYQTSDSNFQFCRNYVVQFVLELQLPWATEDILDQLEGHFGDLSMQKCSSNVVEKCLKCAGEEHCTRVIQELIVNPRLDHIMQDPYGNYVIQAALNQSKVSNCRDLSHLSS